MHDTVCVKSVDLMVDCGAMLNFRKKKALIPYWLTSYLLVITFLWQVCVCLLNAPNTCTTRLRVVSLALYSACGK